MNVAIRIATHALLRNKLRSFLTMLGVIIGVASVVTIVAIGSGAGAAIQSNIAGLGTRSLMVFPGSMRAGGVHSGAFGVSTLTVEDAQAIKAECPAVALTSPVVQSSAQLVYGAQNWATGVTGASADFFEIRSWALTAGTVFSEDDVRTAAKVCLLGKNVKEELFGDGDPIGADIRLNRIPMRVVGVLAEKGDGPGGSQDDLVVIPYTTAMRRILNKTGLREILAGARSEDDVDAARGQIEGLLRQRHATKEGDEPDFTVRTQADLAEMAQTTTNIFTLLLGAIASVSLLVGGIGIMNIMLVSVTERIAEIGIRMAVGARANDIRMQFLLESVILSLAGGSIGIVLSWMVASLGSSLSGYSLPLNAASIFVALLISSAIGVSFGLYPAFKASRLDPIQALRHQ